MASNTSNGGLVTYVIKVGGSAIPDDIAIFSIHIEKRVNRISTARIVILDGEANTGKFDASSSDTFLPGTELSIEAGYDTVNKLVFKGIITRQSITVDGHIGSSLEVECRDAAVKMIVGRKSLTYAQKKDSDIITSIIGSYSGLSSSVTGTETTWVEQVQYYVTDWDFILSLAEMNGLIVTSLNGKVTVAKPDADVSPVLTVQYGDGLIAFRADLNAVTQVGNVKASTWDYKNQVVSSTESAVQDAGPGNLSSKKLAEVIGAANYQLQTTAPLDNADLTNWSKAQLVKSTYAKIQGEVKFQGNNLVEPAKYITLKGLGDRFNGDHFVSGIVHDIADGNWITEASIGMSPLWFIEEPDVMSPAAAGLLPGARGLFNGTVKKMFEDPDAQFRILVDVPLFDQNGAGIWARLSNFYSTSGAGAFFLPEVGDEVVLGFLNEDPRCPIILGSLYSGTKLKPLEKLVPNEKNSLKAIVSKSGIAVEFDDENKVLTMSTPAKNTMIYSDKDKQITISDENENSIVLSKAGITIKSKGAISIEADQTISLKGTQGITVKSSGGDVATSGVNIKETADMQYAAEGGTTTAIKSGMQMTLKSAMIMIN